MERHIPKVVGAWIAGLYDRDRVVARAASEGLNSFLNTPEKVTAFWRKCQLQILEYAIEAIQETKDTLSDERSTTKEDAEAKYFRVVTASLSLVLGLLQKMDDNGIDKVRHRYDDYFAEETVWKSITFSDSSVRKTTCQLVFASLDRKLPYAESSKAKSAIITGGLKTNQSGSASEYVRVLTKLTQNYPDVWSSANASNEKKSPLVRLQAFIAKGSQGSPPKFWEYLDQLLSILPIELLKVETASQILSSVKSGISNRDEPRTNTSSAWKCYIDTAQRLLKNLPAEEQLLFVQEHLFPLMEQYLFSVSGKPTAIPLGPNAMAIFVDVYFAIVQSSTQVISASAEEWDRLASLFCAKISGSLPEVSKDYQQSQESIAEEGRRWFSLVGHIQAKINELENGVPDQTTAASSKVISQSVSILESRNMKPFGAARILEYALSTAPLLFVGSTAQSIFEFLFSLAQEDVAKALSAPSSRYLPSCIHLFGTIASQRTNYETLWAKWVHAVLDLDAASSPSRNFAIAALISRDSAAHLARADTRLQQELRSLTLLLARGEFSDSWETLEAAVTYQSFSSDTYRAIAEEIVKVLSEEPSNTDNSLRALEIISKGNPTLFSSDERIHTALVAKLLGLTEVNDSETSLKAASIRSLLDSHSSGKSPVVGIIQSNLERAGPQSLE